MSIVQLLYEISNEWVSIIRSSSQVAVDAEHGFQLADRDRLALLNSPLLAEGREFLVLFLLEIVHGRGRGAVHRLLLSGHVELFLLLL